MEIPMKSKLRKGVEETLEDITIYIETGNISERKQKEQSKLKK